MQRLLLNLKSEGYPFDFLLARLRVRRQVWSGITGRQHRTRVVPPLSKQAELRWLYKTMDQKARQEFGLCFLYFELRRLLIALRCLVGRNKDGVEQLAEKSLLNHILIRQLQSASEVADAVRILDAALNDTSHTFPRLEKVLVEQGYRQMEEQLVDLFFQTVVVSPKSPALRNYFCQLIDLQNLLSVLKNRRWQLSESRPLLVGGSLSPPQWQSLQRSDQELKLHQTIEQISGIDSFDAPSVERAFLGQIQHRIHRQAQANPESFLLLDYIWALNLHTRNLGLQHWAGDQLAAWEKLG
jgi:hypothetical protein